MQSMINLLTFGANICQTAAGFLVENNKVLLVKHKKLGFWLAPGGHVEQNELPHRAAEREFFEETGIQVKASSWNSILRSFNENYSINEFEDETEYIPNPFATNLHWISEENYQKRLQTGLVNRTDKWPKGCEQHVVFIYLVERNEKDLINLGNRSVEETDGMEWFGMDQLNSLETKSNIKAEAKLALSLKN